MICLTDSFELSVVNLAFVDRRRRAIPRPRVSFYETAIATTIIATSTKAQAISSHAVIALSRSYSMVCRCYYADFRRARSFAVRGAHSRKYSNW